MTPSLEARDTMRSAYSLTRYGKLDNVFYHAVRFISPRVTKDFTQRRARSIWEGTAKRIDSEEMDALRAALIEESRREKEELRTRLAALDEKIAAYEAVVDRQAVARPGEA
ncbi:hypothetical protein [Agrobacterium larrymoorei]|uniref:hypothetical protein n=1 Tax=Agrobacterium larrymoorei TaxID=160699 RepID=UPI0030BD8EE4